MTDICIRCQTHERYPSRLVCGKCIAKKHRENRVAANGGVVRGKGRPVTTMHQKRLDNMEKGWAEVAPRMAWDIARSCALLKMPIRVSL